MVCDAFLQTRVSAQRPETLQRLCVGIERVGLLGSSTTATVMRACIVRIVNLHQSCCDFVC